MEATEEQVAEAIRAYVQAGKRGCDMMESMKCAVEAAMAVAPLGQSVEKSLVKNTEGM